MDILLVAAAVTLGGFFKGLNGFGYALISTSVLATFLPPEQAVSLMIIPLIAANIELASELGFQELKNCLRNFSGLITSLLIGVTAAMLFIDKIPQDLMRKLVGVLALLYVASNISFMDSFFEKIREFCFKTWEPAIGFFSGVIYGSSNVALPAVTYLKSRKLGERKFASMLGLTILMVSVYRLLIAAGAGLYPNPSSILVSLFAAAIGVTAVFTGRKASEKIPGRFTSLTALVLIAFIGLRLLLS